MGNDFTKEYPSTWDQSDVKKWKGVAVESIRVYYLGFAGRKWDEYSKADLPLLRTKICYAMYGLPTEDAEQIEDAYSEKQREEADKIKEMLWKLYLDSPAKKFRVSIAFIACKQEENEFLLPIFSVSMNDNEKSEDRKFVDTQCRTYANWKDWKENNRLPMLKYAYPTSGYLSCKEYSFAFDPNCDPVVEYGTSPACDLSARILRQFDWGSGIVSMGAGVISIASLFTPVGPLVLLGTAVAGGTAATYGLGRSVVRLYDKGTHGESLTDLESATLWIGIAATPLHFVTSLANGALAAGAQQGRIFSNTARIFATMLNFTTVGVDGVMLAFGLANLIEKNQRDQLSSLDVLQFSMSIFFFCNTVIQPKTARAIIDKAQNQYIDRCKNQMTDTEAKAAFDKFLERNQGDNTITAKSKVIRTINRMDDPNAFFKDVGDSKVDIGGRKGRTVLVTDENGRTNRINPNRAFWETRGEGKGGKFNRDFNRLQSCYNKDPKDVKLNGKKIFQNLDNRQKARIRQVYGGTARKYNSEVILTAHSIAEKMGCETLDQLLSIIEIVAAEVEGKDGAELTKSLGNISSGQGRNAFIQNIDSDVRRVEQIAAEMNLKFADSLKAVYHFRKHGPDFPHRILENHLDFYIGEIPKKLAQDANLYKVIKQDDIIRKCYITSKDQFMVVTEKPGEQVISTMFRKPEEYRNFLNRVAERHANKQPLPTVNDAAQRLAASVGYPTLHINIAMNGRWQSVENYPGLDPHAHEEISRIICTLNREVDPDED